MPVNVMYGFAMKSVMINPKVMLLANKINESYQSSGGNEKYSGVTNPNFHHKPDHLIVFDINTHLGDRNARPIRGSDDGDDHAHVHTRIMHL